MVSVATGHVEYYPPYISIGNPYNSVRCAHRNAITPIAFLAIPKSMFPAIFSHRQSNNRHSGDHRYDDSTAYRNFKHQLYHASIAAILQPLHSGMTGSVVYRCSDSHFRCVIYDLIAFIADYPEQVMLTGIVQGWCPKSVSVSICFGQSDADTTRCTASPANLDVNATRYMQTLTDGLVQVLDHKRLWNDHGIDDSVIVCQISTCSCCPFLTIHDPQPFTSDFLRSDIYEMILPDILHQLIKGTFKDHLVTWICEYLVIKYGECQASIILDDIDQQYFIYHISLYSSC